MINDGTGTSANCAIKVIEIDERPHLCIFATRDILVGEELRYDYGVNNLPWRSNKKVNFVL